jgi:hypothetical protein
MPEMRCGIVGGIAICPEEAKLYLFPKHLDQLLGPSSLLLNSYRGYFLRIKRSGREVDRSTISKAKVKNTWSYISTPPYSLHGRDNFAFLPETGASVFTARNLRSLKEIHLPHFRLPPRYD